MRIWIDLANSPQVLFFVPIIKELERRGHFVQITTKQYAQTVELANLFGLKHELIGKHGGSKLGNISVEVLKRSLQLFTYQRSRKFDLCVSHNSYSQILTARLAGIPSVTIMDYEYQPANHIAFRLAQKIVVPEVFPDWALKNCGAYRHKVEKYHGLKEQVYLNSFSPQPGYFQTKGIPVENPIAVIRPPASWTLYQHFDNPLFDQLLEYICAMPHVTMLVLPRVKSQAEPLKKLANKNLIIPNEVLSGPDALYHADFVFSGGGTMNREAAILGTPAYSFFMGKRPAVDNYLADLGRLTFLSNEDEIRKIKIVKNGRHEILQSPNLINEIIQQILN